VKKDKIPKTAIPSNSSKKHKNKLPDSVKKDIQSQQFKEKEHPYIALKHYNSNCECFSDWSKKELKRFSQFNKKLSNTTWENIIAKHSGFKCKPIAYNTVKSESIKNAILNVSKKIDEGITFIELRVDGKSRVHGFRGGDVFFLVVLDRKHRL
jgi:hypothetical protein